MSEREVALDRVSEKARLRKAWRDMTRMFIGTSSIMFTTFIVIWSIQNLPSLHMPLLYKWNAVVVIFSSLLLWRAQKKIKKDEVMDAYQLTGWTLVFGAVFLTIQLIGWQELVTTNKSFRNVLLPFSFIHIIHVVVGLIFLTSVFLKLRRFQIHSRSMVLATNVSRFWHFLGLVWVMVIVVLA